MASRLSSKNDLSTEELLRLVYLGIYSARRTTVDGILEASKVSNFIDHSFVGHIGEGLQANITFEDLGLSSVRNHTDRVRFRNVWAEIDRDLLSTRLLKMDKLSLVDSPGFCSRRLSVTDSIAHRDLTRIYLSIRPANAKWIIGEFCDALEERGLASSCKLLAHPGSYFRSDACILYVHRSTLTEAITFVNENVEGSLGVLRDKLPLGTCRIGRGMGWADDGDFKDENGRPLSFGQWIAGGVVELVAKFGRDCSAEQLLDHFAAKGRSARKIYEA